MAYLANLIDQGTFDKIVVSFLPVGHTHEDIDQMFSRIAVYLRRHDCWDFQMLGEAATRSYKKGGMPFKHFHLDRITNYSHYIDAHLRPGALEDITNYYQFRMFRRGNTDGVPVLQAREWPGGGGIWVGVGEKTNWTRIFKTDHLPDLRVALIPPAQRRERPSDYAIEKLREGLQVHAPTLPSRLV